jgi:hypothetical protein
MSKRLRELSSRLKVKELETKIGTDNKIVP